MKFPNRPRKFEEFRGSKFTCESPECQGKSWGHPSVSLTKARKVGLDVCGYCGRRAKGMSTVSRPMLGP